MDSKLVYTVSEMAKSLNIGMNSAYNLTNREDFPKIFVGRRIIIPVKGLEKWLELNSKMAL